MKQELQRLWSLVTWGNTTEADTILGSAHPHTVLYTWWGILVMLMALAFVFAICFTFKKLVYDKFVRIIKSSRHISF